MASLLQYRVCEPYFLWGVVQAQCRRNESDNSTIRDEAPPGLFFDSCSVTLDDSADSAANSLHVSFDSALSP